MNRRRTPNNFTYVSPCVKYMIFILNFAFWNYYIENEIIPTYGEEDLYKLPSSEINETDEDEDYASQSSDLFGGLLIGIGAYAFLDKWPDFTNGLIKVETIYDVVLNISLVLILAGGVVFIVSFSGFVGALRENTCLLKFYSLCLLILFLLEMGIAIMGFVFPHTLQSILEESFTEKIIHTYRDDVDLQNLIDFAQQEFHCCGLSSDGYLDWSKNEYFNCSSPSVEKCGVPFSCCINATDISSGLVNIMCGYGVQESPAAEASKKVWTSGCIDVVRSWAERNLYTIAGIALFVALSQLFVIYLGKTLEGQIELQKSRWNS